jgi:hypothetical protein
LSTKDVAIVNEPFMNGNGKDSKENKGNMKLVLKRGVIFFLSCWNFYSQWNDRQPVAKKYIFHRYNPKLMAEITI